MIEYKVRPVIRYVVTRYASEPATSGFSGNSRVIGEFDRKDTAYHVGYALATADRERLGLAPGSMEVIFPDVGPLDADEAIVT